MVKVNRVTIDGTSYLEATKGGMSTKLNLDYFEPSGDDDRTGLKLVQWLNCSMLDCDEDGVVMHDTPENRQLLVAALKGAE